MIPKDRTSALAIGLLVLTALTVRLIELDQHFLLIDEGFVGVAARDIAFNNTPMWDAVSNAPYVWGLAQLISILGDTPFVLRLPSALFGASVGVLIFLFLRRWAGQKTAVLSAAIYALHPFGAAFTRVAFVDALQLPVLLLAVAAIDNYLLKHERRWLWIALISAAIAFILKYNALAILGCWMFVGLLLGRYPIKRSIGAGLGIVVLSLGTLLLWPFNAPVWFFSFLAKGGSYDSNYIINFYEFAYRHVVFGTATLPIAIIGYALARFSLDKEIAQRFDHLVVFSLAYYALLLILGRPFQRYLLVLTVPVAMVYAMIVVQGYRASRRWMAERDLLDLLRAAAGLAVTLGILIQGTRSWTNYIAYLDNDIDLAQASMELKNADRVFWPYGSSSTIGYYQGFDQYYSLATRGPLSNILEKHYFSGMTSPYSADTLPFGVLLARQELDRVGLINAVINPSTFVAKVKQLDSAVDARRNARTLVNYYHSEIVRPGNLLIEPLGVVDQNGEPMLYQIELGEESVKTIPSGFEQVSVYVDGLRYADTSYRRKLNQGGIRILRKTNAE